MVFGTFLIKEGNIIGKRMKKIWNVKYRIEGWELITIHLQQTLQGRGVVSFVLASRDIAVGKFGGGINYPCKAAEMGR
jgi:hypothetical protein